MRQTPRWQRDESKHPGVDFAVRAAQALGVTTDELLGVTTARKPKAGRKSKLDRYMEQVRDLPRADQQYVLRFLEQVVRRSKP